MQHTYTCYDQHRFCHVSLKVKSHHYRLEHLNETLYKVLQCMDQQLRAK